ncbi:Zn-dependent metalloprotease [Streptomyces sp. V4I2]|nr:Zn-dependent metalloprotease [Streptomyces sp. V4I2]
MLGAGLLMPSINGVGLRSLKAPGTAYDDEVLGKDPQPDHMRDYVHTERDNGGVHISDSTHD